MKSYMIGLTNEEKNNILDQHRKTYDGYVVKQNVSNLQPLEVQDFANDKHGIVVNNRGEVKSYTNVGINESSQVKDVENKEQYEKVHYLGTKNKKKSRGISLTKDEIDEIMDNLEKDSQFEENVDKLKDSVTESLKWFKKIN